jgi:acyl CoA:acetate/3-ketoacid CoA transferase alpha subunit
MSTARPRPATPVGPVDLAVIGFAGELRQGGIRKAVADAVDNGSVRVLDILVVRKDPDGRVFMYDAEDAGENTELLGFPTVLPDLVGEDDARAIAAEMAPDTTVLVIAWENTWAARIAETVRELDGQVLVMERIPAADVQAVVDAMTADAEGTEEEQS